MSLSPQKLARILDRGLDPHTSYTALEIRIAVGQGLVLFFRRLQEVRVALQEDSSGQREAVPRSTR